MKRNQILDRYYGLLWYIARSFHEKSSSRLTRVLGEDDLFQEAVIGAIKAIDSFRGNRGSLTAWINLKARGQVLDAKRRSHEIPQRRWQEIKKLLDVAEMLTPQLGREPCDEEIAKHLNVSIEEVQRKWCWIVEPVRLDIAEVVPAEREKRPDEQRGQKERKLCLRDCIHAELTDLERLVLVQHIVYKVPRRRLAEILGLSTKKVRGIESSALNKTRACLEERGWHTNE